MRSVYPTAQGQSLGTAGSSATPPIAGSTNAGTGKNPPSQVAMAATVGASGNPLMAWGILIILLFALMFIAKRVGSEQSEFASIKMSFYNVIVISLAAVIGINFFKLVFTKFPVPGISTIFLNA
jgi:hypothetical protein